MALADYAYGSVAGVVAYVRHLANASGTFDATTTPTLTEVEAFINQRSARLNACLAEAGYAVPIPAGATMARAILDYYVCNGAAADCELTQRSAGDSDTENDRERMFLKIWEGACAFVGSAAFASLPGVGQPNPSPGVSGLYVGGRTSSGQRLRPVFTRTTAGNSPTAESGPAEPEWTDERSG